MCCRKGQVNLLLPELPTEAIRRPIFDVRQQNQMEEVVIADFMHQLFSNPDFTRAEGTGGKGHFKQFIRAYNNALAMCSCAAKMDHPPPGLPSQVR